MVNNSVDFLSDKPYVSLASSTIHKEDIIKARLHELKIAYKILIKCEHCRDEFIRAVKGGANHPAEATAPVEVLKSYDYYRRAPI
jgi:hypothetical protein